MEASEVLFLRIIINSSNGHENKIRARLCRC